MKKYILVIVSLFVLSSCNDLFDIDPATQVRKEQLFETELGFTEALMGVYLGAVNESIYGRELTYGTIDIIANTYSYEPTSRNGYLADFDFEYSANKSELSGIWIKLYKLIAQCNLILEEIESKKSLFNVGNYELVKGECLGLRAYFHFELYRMYGAPPTTGDDRKALPYYTKTQSSAAPQLTAKEYMDMVISDFTSAYNILADVDPIIEDVAADDSNVYSIDVNGLRNHRSNKMNYRAVTALMARAYLYRGDKVNAYKYAKEVEPIYPNVAQYGYYNNTYMSFWISYSEAEKRTAKYFSQNVYYTTKLVNDDTSKAYVFETNKYQEVDARLLRNFMAREYETETFLYKYSTLSQCHTVIKGPEISLILAETAAANGDDPLPYINALRDSRGLTQYPIIDTNDLENEIYKEYMKEFMGEGQLFYYLKRKNMQSFKAPNTREFTVMPETNYMFPIPDNEYIYGNLEKI